MCVWEKKKMGKTVFLFCKASKTQESCSFVAFTTIIYPMSTKVPIITVTISTYGPLGAKHCLDDRYTHTHTHTHIHTQIHTNIPPAVLSHPMSHRMSRRGGIVNHRHQSCCARAIFQSIHVDIIKRKEEGPLGGRCEVPEIKVRVHNLQIGRT